MKYVSKNELDCFSFHDAFIKQLSIGSDLCFRLEALNATKDNSQNPHTSDMCIGEAEVVFESATIDDVIFPAYTVSYKGPASESVTDSIPERIALPEERSAILRNSPGSYCYILQLEIMPPKETGQYSVRIQITSQEAVYNLYLTYKNVVIRWEEFTGPAWYESDEWKNKR